MGTTRCHDCEAWYDDRNGLFLCKGCYQKRPAAITREVIDVPRMNCEQHDRLTIVNAQILDSIRLLMNVVVASPDSSPAVWVVRTASKLEAIYTEIRTASHQHLDS